MLSAVVSEQYGSSRYRYRYILPADIFADTDTDIFALLYRPPIPIPIFFIFATIWPTTCILTDICRYFGRYPCILTDILANTDITDIQSSRYGYRYRYDRYRYPVCQYPYICIGMGRIYLLTDISVQP
jgi:hypothetical protein